MKGKGLKWVTNFNGRRERKKDSRFVVNYNGKHVIDKKVQSLGVTHFQAPR
jgi:hypothetical protein